MAKLTNLTRRDIDLPTRHVIPRMGALPTTNETIRSTDNWPMLNGLILSGAVSVEFDPEPSLEDPAATVTETIATPVVETPGEPVKVKTAKA